MTFPGAIASCFRKYAQFSGRARRQEFWLWYLFCLVTGFCLALLDLAVFPSDEWSPLSTIFNLVTLVPSFAVGARRLHDIGRTGWWQLLWFVPILGWIPLIIWTATKGKAGENSYGEDPLQENTAELVNQSA